MDPTLARRLVAGEGAAALARAEIEADPGSLAAGSRLRRDFDPDLAAAALTQVTLRRRATAKFGQAAHQLWFTADGLEQATRPVVSRWRAQRLAAAGARRVADLGCGLGFDALAMVEAGLDVLAVERDDTTAILATANLTSRGAGSRTRVLHADATTVELADDQTAFCDPARRTSTGRTWNVAGFTPPWGFVTGLFERPAGAVVKLGPGLPHRIIPDHVVAEWVSDQGDVVEASLWSPSLAATDGALLPAAAPRAATLLPSGERIVATGNTALLGPPGRFIHEPDGAVLVAGALGALAAATRAHRVHPDIAYLSTADPVASPFWTSFEVLETLPWREKDLRHWVREHEIGTLEIKKRGIEVDPAALRRRLRLRGPGRATILITPTTGSAVVLVVRRCALE